MFIDETDVTGTLMNRVYRIVWNASRQAWMVAAELTRGKTKSQVGRKKTLQKVISSSLLVTTSLAFSSNVLAVTEYNWIASSGDWIIGSNWDTGVVPENQQFDFNMIYISNNGEATITSTVNLDDINSLYVGSDSNETGALNIQDNGQLTIRNFYIGSGKDAEGEVLVTGGNAKLTVMNTSTFGYNGNAKFTLNNGATVTANTIRLASNNTSTGTINIGAAKGETAVSGGTFDVNIIEFGNGNGTLVLNHTDGGLQFRSEMRGNGNIELYSGTTRFIHNDHNLFSGDIKLYGDILAIEAGDSLSFGDESNLANYEQFAEARLRLGVLGMDNYARLNVAGTATFAKDTGLDVNVSGAPSLTMGGSLARVISAGTLDVSTFDLKDSSAIYDSVSYTHLTLPTNREV